MSELPQRFNFELVSPEKKVISETAWQVVIPGEEGDVGVRAGHMALVMSVRPGVVEVTRERDGVKEKLFVAGGFADISATQCTLLAEEAIPLAKLDAAKLEEQVKTLDAQIQVTQEEAEKARLQARRAMVDSMLIAVKAA